MRERESADAGPVRVFPTDDIAAVRTPTAVHGVIQRLPDDISELDRHELRKASDARDERLSILFRRWPSLSRIEMKEIRQVSDERQRLARCIGRLRKGRRTGRKESEQAFVTGSTTPV